MTLQLLDTNRSRRARPPRQADQRVGGSNPLSHASRSFSSVNCSNDTQVSLEAWSAIFRISLIREIQVVRVALLSFLLPGASSSENSSQFSCTMPRSCRSGLVDSTSVRAPFPWKHYRGVDAGRHGPRRGALRARRCTRVYIEDGLSGRGPFLTRAQETVYAPGSRGPTAQRSLFRRPADTARRGARH